MPISLKVILELETRHHQGFQVCEGQTNKVLTQVKKLIEIRPSAYYRHFDNAATAKEWPQLDQWREYSSNQHLHIKQIEHQRLMYGKHKTNKYADLFNIHYESQSNLTHFKKYLIDMLHSYYQIGIRRLKIDCINDTQYRQMVVIIYK